MNRTVELRIGRRQSYDDAEVVRGLRLHSGRMEEWFYRKARTYFNQHFREVFFDQDRKQEIFQSAFLKLWTEIDNGTIIAEDDGTVERRQRNGEMVPMTCSLTTFLMAFAKNEYREMVRSNKLDCYAEIYDTPEQAEVQQMYGDENDEETRNRIVDDCIQRISPRCTEILTMFYYEEKTLDEILAARHETNSSKNGLKTAKNKCMNTLRSLCNEEFRRYNI